MSGRIVLAAVCLGLLSLVAFGQSIGGTQAAPTSVEVSSGTVALTESSSATLRTPVLCSVGPTSRFSTPSGGLTYAVTRATDGGVYGFGRRTQVLVQNVDDKDGLSCGVGRLDAGTTPSCSAPGWGNTLLPNGGAATYEVSENYEVWCLGCGGAVSTEVTEALCVP